MKLNAQDARARRILIRVAQGQKLGHANGYISYKALWSKLSSKPWGQARSRDIVSCITRVSGFELAHDRPPLNELVVRLGLSEPTESWNAIKRYLETTFQVTVPYSSHREAQLACWGYWSGHRASKANDSTVMNSSSSDDEAEEGLRQDRTSTFRRRNQALIAKRKQKDKYTCQACGFFLKIGHKYIIDCHHTKPLGLSDTVRVTHIDDLICLCPTCHRLAHTRRFPLSVNEIRPYVIRSAAGA